MIWTFRVLVILLLFFSCRTKPAATAGSEKPSLARRANNVQPVWPEFLGPRRDGTSTETGLNWDWNKKRPRTLWKIPLGNAFSSLSVVGDRLYTMSQRGQRDVIVCLDAKTGKELWTTDAARSYLDRQRHGAGPRATPTYHQGKLYCQMALGELLCLQADGGKEIWRKDIFKDTGAASLEGEWYYWGVSFSPLVVGDLVIVQPGGRDGNSVVAFNKDTGNLVWKVGSDPINYASPIFITVAGQQQVVCPTGQSILGLEPATGKVMWRYPFGNQFNATGSNPVWTANLLFISSAYGGGCAALDIVPRETGWEARPKWKSKKNLQSLFATSIVHDGHIYGCHGDIGAILLRCLELKTGKVKWEERLGGRCTLLGVEGNLLVLDERGTVFLVKMDPRRFVLRGTLPDLLAPKAWAAPVLAGGRLYLRDQRHVVCLDVRK
jgi:outer membrane protein assembly factor BamB